MNNILEKYKWLRLIIGALLIAAGLTVLLIALKENGSDSLSKFLSYAIAIILFIFGGISIILSFFNSTLFNSTLIYGALAISLGVVFIIHWNVLGDSIPLFLGVLLTAAGGIVLIDSIIITFKKIAILYKALFYVLSAVLITAGILILVYQEKSEQAIYAATGILFMILGIMEIVLGLVYMLKKPNSSSKAITVKEKK